MSHKLISFDEFSIDIHHTWDKQWFLLSCGDFASHDFNSMTVSWGSLGIIWHKPMAQVFVRKSRYTFDFFERFDNFTLCTFPENSKKTLATLGAKSGREMDKITKSGFTPIPSKTVSSPGYKEAETIIECRKAYWQDMAPGQILLPDVTNKFYGDQDYHRIYFGEVLAIYQKEK